MQVRDGTGGARGDGAGAVAFARGQANNDISLAGH